MTGYVTATKTLISGRMRELTDALHIDPVAYRRQIRCIMPWHDDKNPSFRLDARRERAFCTCGSYDVLDLIRGMQGLADAAAACDWARQVLGLPVRQDLRQETQAERTARKRRLEQARLEAEQREMERRAKDARYRAEQYKRGLQCWQASAPIDGTAGEAYMRGRRITCELPATMRYLTAYGDDKLPAIVSAMGIAHEPEPSRYAIEAEAIAGWHLTFICADGSGKAQNVNGVSKVTLVPGHTMPIMLVPPSDGLGLIIAEGIEEALSWQMATGLGAWAAGSAGRLPGIAEHVPGWIECATLIEDDNAAGRDGCAALRDALMTRGIEVLIERGEGGGDVAP